jgi:acetylornithine deacetylase/succinyl-diaminopimelate desuccinylase-like protein
VSQPTEPTEPTAAEGARCLALLGDLIRIPTVNRGTGESSDGDERPAAELLADFLRDAGLEPKLLEKKKGRTNVVARVRGTGAKPPILLNAHLDVVEADGAGWRHPPFGGEIHDGYLWGRGAIDMKHHAAMSACVMVKLAEAARDGRPLERDVIFAGVADEEAGCALGSIFLAEEHPDEVRAEYMLGEVGGFSLHLFGRTFYPIQVAEKGVCWVRATYEGKPGHGSMPDPESAVVKLGRAIARLGGRRMPIHPTKVVKSFLDGLARELPRAQGAVLRRLGTRQAAGLILDHLVRDAAQRRSFGAMLANTASPTVLRAGGKVNVIPERASVEIDGRTLPGQTEPEFLAELRDVLGGDPELEVLRSLPPVEASPDTPMFRHLANVLRGRDPNAHPLPWLVPGFTDAKGYARLGTTCYGFAPVRFDPAHMVSFGAMYHGHDERVPVEGLSWGFSVLHEAVTRFGAPGAVPPEPR